MKKYSFIIAAFLMLALVSCESKKEAGAISDVAKKNLDTHHAVVGMFEKGDWSKAADHIDKDAIDHGAGPTGEDLKGIDAIMANFNEMGKVIGDMKTEVIKEFADDEYVMAWTNQTATAKIDMPQWGMKKGVPSTYNSIEVSKYKDGKVIEHWSFMTMADMMKMMGGGGNPMPMDTTKMAPKDPTSK